jgi:hypothetical protein
MTWKKRDVGTRVNYPNPQTQTGKKAKEAEIKQKCQGWSTSI